jgi:hypothetical protein
MRGAGDTLADVEAIIAATAPHAWDVVRAAAAGTRGTWSTDRYLTAMLVVSMLANAHSQRADVIQSAIGYFLLNRGVSRVGLNVLSRFSITTTYETLLARLDEAHDPATQVHVGRSGLHSC